MKIFLFGLIAILGLSGCAEYIIDPSDPTIAYQYGCVDVCDDFGCRNICNVQYYNSPEGVVYWDTHFNAWIGPSGYWWHGSYYRGGFPRFHEYYHHGWYHGGGVYHGGYRGGWHGGGGFHGGGHHR